MTEKKLIALLDELDTAFNKIVKGNYRMAEFALNDAITTVQLMIQKEREAASHED